MKKNKHGLLLLPYMTAIWFFATINSFFTWNDYKYWFHIIPSFFVVFVSIPIVRNNQHYKYAKGIFASMFVFVLWILLHHNLWGAVEKIVGFLPLFFLFFWDKEYLYRSYQVVRKVFVFYSVGCPIISVLSLVGLLNYIPFYILPAQELIHQEAGLCYHVYGVFAVLNNNTSLVRCCGMALEPGHFSIYLGCIYMIDRLMGRKINRYFVIGALSAFSSTFFIIMFITEFFIALSFKRNFLFSFFKYVSIFVLIVVTVYSFIPQSYKNEIEFLFYERNMERVTNAFVDNNSLTAALDVRASEEGVYTYDRLKGYEFFFGVSKSNDLLSDYRGLIVRLGMIGLLLSFISFIFLVKGKSLNTKLLLSCVYLLVILHRSWMIPNSYFFTLLFFAVALPSDYTNWTGLYNNYYVRGRIEKLQNRYS